MKNYKISPGFRPVGANKTGINYILILVENCLQNNAMHDFSVWLRTGSNPSDINQFQSHTRKGIYIVREEKILDCPLSLNKSKFIIFFFGGGDNFNKGFNWQFKIFCQTKTLPSKFFL